MTSREILRFVIGLPCTALDLFFRYAEYPELDKTNRKFSIQKPYQRREGGKGYTVGGGLSFLRLQGQI